METGDTFAQIAATIERFFIGMHTGDPRRLRAAFDPHAQLWGYYHGDFYRQSLDEWIVEIEGMGKPSENGEPFDMRIVAVDVTGRSAAVKTATLYQGLRFTDYLTLVEFDDGWKIVNKTYHHD
ncbi:hypothetical protein PSP6_200086 [Paraburkholderia tropica]|uniref:nuclear transport factor 2 family protein n=1 Tax=Paraburkholderia tropica TaxID=92647 RepID=UPI001CB671E2|nr:nuclear transport factor 2 family protein [Paraburkholderia tropica]CAG9200250.1 hypothetical protein PSP6_200086 [Paraburkholderia tropica]